MFVKIQRTSYTAIYECDHCYVQYRKDVAAIGEKIDADVVLEYRGHPLETKIIPVTSGDEVYIMNNNGKTIDSRWIA